MSKQIYAEGTTRDLLHKFAKTLEPGQKFSPKDAVRWFAENYPRINPSTVAIHVRRMVVNDPHLAGRKCINRNVKWNLFFKVDNNRFRLWNEAIDGPPQYPDQSTPQSTDSIDAEDEDEETTTPNEAAEEFAREQDLRDYLAKNLETLEPGLRLHEDGIEHPVAGGFIDILALDKQGNPVVIELKVSRGHQRAIGQLAYYLAWVKENRANGKPVRGMIVASEVTEKVRLAASQLPNTTLFEYSITFSIHPVKG
ncbi:MAG: DUF91 domain-containing protein [Cellvibrionales bacterium]|nr:DUF91 domain-containing protein [Cellvibrionales bacterium]